MLTNIILNYLQGFFNYLQRLKRSLATKPNINIIWKKKGLSEVGIDKVTKKILIKVDKEYYRPTEVFKLQGNSKKAKKELKWSPDYTIDQLITEMIEEDLNNIQKRNN